MLNSPFGGGAIENLIAFILKLYAKGIEKLEILLNYAKNLSLIFIERFHSSTIL